jgi:hypothetical protein
MSMFKNLRSFTMEVFALVSTAVTAGGSGDATEIVGPAIVLSNLSRRASSVEFAIPVRAVLGATQTCVVVGKIETSPDGSTWTELAANATLLTLTGGSGGTTETGVARIGCDLIQSDFQQVRVKVTPDLNRANTDTAVVGAGVAVFASSDQQP